MTRLSRRHLLRSGAAAGVLAASGFAVQARPQRGGALRVGACSGAAHIWHGAVFETLTETLGDGRLSGALATRWEASQDARVWTLTLRKDVAFHDGKMLTAQDVAASLSRRPSLLGPVQQIRAISPLQMEIELAAGNSGLPFLLTDRRLAILPTESTDRAQSVGTGLYRKAVGTEHHLEPVADHYKSDNAGWFDRIEITNPGSRDGLVALREGRLDLLEQPDTTALRQVRQHRRLAVSHEVTNEHLQIAVSGPDASMVARALKLAIDREALVQTWLGGFGRIGADHPNAPGSTEKLRHDPDRAAFVLRQADSPTIGVTVSSELVARPGSDRLLKTLHNTGKSIGLKLVPGQEMDANGPMLALRLAPAAPTPDAALAAFPRDGLSDTTRFNTLLTEARVASNTATRLALLEDLQNTLSHEATTLVPAFPDVAVAHTARLVAPPTGGAFDRIAEQWSYG